MGQQLEECDSERSGCRLAAGADEDLGFGGEPRGRLLLGGQFAVEDFSKHGQVGGVGADVPGLVLLDVADLPVQTLFVVLASRLCTEACQQE